MIGYPQLFTNYRLGMDIYSKYLAIGMLVSSLEAIDALFLLEGESWRAIGRAINVLLNEQAQIIEQARVGLSADEYQDFIERVFAWV